MSYIPLDDLGFNSWERHFMSTMLPKAAGFGIPTAATDALSAYQSTYHAAWILGGIGAKTTRTSIQTKQKTEARYAYEHNDEPEELGLRAFIKAYIINNPLVSDDDLLEMKVPIHKKTRTKHLVATENYVVFRSENIGDGTIKTLCYSSGKDNQNPYSKSTSGDKRTYRPSKEKGYDVRISFILIPQGAPLPTGHDSSGMTKEIYTKARIVRYFDEEFIGYNLCEYAQWYNSKHPELAGPWSKIQTTVIS